MSWVVSSWEKGGVGGEGTSGAHANKKVKTKRMRHATQPFVRLRQNTLQFIAGSFILLQSSGLKS